LAPSASAAAQPLVASLPFVNSAAMNADLTEIARMVGPGDVAIPVLDGTVWHSSKTLAVPDNGSLLPQRPCGPALHRSKTSGSIGAPTASPSATSTTIPPSSLQAAWPGTAAPTIQRPYLQLPIASGHRSIDRAAGIRRDNPMWSRPMCGLSLALLILIANLFCAPILTPTDM